MYLYVNSYVRHLVRPRSIIRGDSIEAANRFFREWRKMLERWFIIGWPAGQSCHPGNEHGTDTVELVEQTCHSGMNHLA